MTAETEHAAMVHSTFPPGVSPTETPMIALQYPLPPDVPRGPDRIFALLYLLSLSLAIVLLLLPREWTRRIARIALRWNRERND